MRKIRLRYLLLQLWARIAARVVYRRIDVTGAQRIAGDRPLVLAPNHSNGLADIAVLVAKLPRFPRFGAASTWWNSRAARLLFNFGGVLPIYRGRDGSTKKNVSTFAALHDVLDGGEPVVIFPEGEMNLEPSLLPLKTGVARIGFGAAVEARVPGVAIVPVGLVYEDRGRFRSDAEIFFGEPIEIAEWLDLHREARHKAVRGIMHVLTERLADASVTHGTHDEAECLDRAAAIVRGTRSYADRNALRRALADAVEAAGGTDSAEYRKLAAAVDAYGRRRAEQPVDDRVRLDLALLAPAAIAGVVVNAPVVLGAWAASARVPDDGWRASAMGIAGTVLVPVVWSVEYAVVHRRLGRSRALWLLTTAVFGGVAALAWIDRWNHRRDAPGTAAVGEGEAEVAAVVMSLVGSVPA